MGDTMRLSTIFSLFCMVQGLLCPLLAREPLSLEERVKAQEAIERVYYAHRIWPKENLGPKPPFEKMVPRATIEAKVTETLKKCVALDQYWQRPIQSSQLQAEIDRMAQETRDPATLFEIFVALNRDPYLIAECLARPILADRLIHNWYANDMRFHGRVKQQAAAALVAGPQSWINERGARYERGIRILDVGDSDDLPIRQESPAARKLDKATFEWWMGEVPSEGRAALRETDEGFLLIATSRRGENRWEGENCFFAKRGFSEWWEAVRDAIPPTEPARAHGEDFSFRAPISRAPETCDLQDTWDYSASLSVVRDPRQKHTAVWTGTEMIIWGGTNSNFLCTGGRYNPSTDSWAPTSTGTGCPAGREGQVAIWTGSEMVVWGGESGGVYMNTGGRYDPSSDSWAPTSTGTGCPIPRLRHTAIWTGSEMVVWGGYWYDGPNATARYENTGGRYNPASDVWSATSTGANCPSPRQNHSAIWTGSEMVVWGGNSPTVSNAGGKYNPTTDSWVPTSTGPNCPAGRYGHTAGWTGSEMLVWGGYDNVSTFFNTGGRYNPSSNSWVPLSSGTNCPTGRYAHTAVWTGSEMVIWGGTNGTPMGTGGRYNPTSDSWIATSTGVHCPAARARHTAVWTGAEMIIWGGATTLALDTGARFDPTTDTWVPTSSDTNYPSARYLHATVWTGSEMVVWGGSGSTYSPDGGRYYPATDSWVATSTGSDCPTPRCNLTAVWTGSRVIIWGGSNGASLNTGGQYDPISDSWTATSVGTNCPTGRSLHTAIWTGSKMIVWGGTSGSSLNTGGCYSPATDAWSATSTGAGCPSARYSHTAVWTGSEMIIWGGYDSTYFNTGGRYNPATNEWTATSTGTNCPVSRRLHTAIWTGSVMIIWGGYRTSATIYSSGGQYSPISDSWTPTSMYTNNPGPRYGHTAVWSGSEMIIWGGYSGEYQKTGARYKPATDSWLPTALDANTPPTRYWHNAVWTGSTMIVWGGFPTTASGGIYRPGASISGPSSCQGTGALLTTQTYSTYQWYRDGELIPSATSQSYLATQNGTYSVAVTNSAGCAGLSTNKTVTLQGISVPDVLGYSPNTCPATKVTLTALGGFASGQWSLNGTPIPGAVSQSYDASVSGNYTVNAVDFSGCAGTSAAIPVSITFCAQSEVSPALAPFPARLTKDGPGCDLNFQKISGATGYALYEGNIGNYYSHGSAPGNVCSLSPTDLGTGEMRTTFAPSEGNHYYLITAFNAANEGPSGYDSNGAQIPSSESTCAP